MTNETCDCCEGVTRLTPLKTANRPGLSTLAYRVGTHAAFFETMKARLSSIYLDLPRDEFDQHGRPKTDRVYPLRSLTTRAADDPAIALLDSWAVIGAVLAFYQERIANEGYLATATERRSILELARLVGYALRPGVSASTYLAYTIDANTKEPVEIPAGAQAQSVPGPGELPQTFETSEALEARALWNNLRPRQTRPQVEATIEQADGRRIYLKGASTNLKINDPLLIDFGDGSKPQLFRVLDVQADTTLDRTVVTLDTWLSAAKLAGMTYRARLLALARRRQDTSGLKRSARAEMVGRVVEHLKNLERQATSAATEAELAEFVQSETLPRLKEELAVAEEDVKFRKIQQWLAPLIEEVGAAGAAAPSAPSSAAPKTLPSAIVLAKKDPVIDVIGKLTLPPSVPPRNTLYLDRDPKTTFASHTDIGAQLVTTFQPALRQTFAAALANGRVTAGNQMHVYALRVKAAPFGQAAPKKILALEQGTGRIITVGEWPIVESATIQHEKADVLFLDASYDKIQPDSWVVVEMSAVPQFNKGDGDIARVEPAQRPYLVTKAIGVQADIARAEYGISGKTTRLDLEEDWLKITPPAAPGGGIGIVGAAPDAQPPAPAAINVEAAAPSDQPIYDRDFQTIRNTTVYAQTEELPLAEAPIEDEICHAAGDWLELDGLYSDLKSGRWLIVAGERSDIRVPDPEDNSKLVAIRGVNASELVMLAAVIQDVATETGQPVSQLDDSEDDTDEQALPNEKLHTFIKLAKNLEYCYRRDAVTIYGNVVKATHGETRKEVLGSGDGSQALQSFALRQPPLTFVAAPNPSGVDSTLKVYVNEVRWQEVDSLAGLAPTDRKFITRTDDAGKTSATFGNGQRGARLPSGRENVRAEYRSGIGKGGNVRAGQLSLLMTRPLGVKDVVNPLRASGGADKESRDQARKNVPLAVMALDRLVSVPDYADFTRTFAGIGKAAATRLPVGQREIVHVTIAGADDIPIDVSSDLYRNLVLALRQNGDPYQPFQVELRELLLLVVSANVSIVPEYVWDNVATQIRTRMLDRFGFERRDLGQDVVLSDVISTIQAVPGVAYVDIDLLAAIPEKKADGGTRRLLTPEEITESINKLLTERADEQGRPDAQKVHPVSRITVGLAGIEDDTLRPAQLAILSPAVPDTLIVNRI